MFPKSFFILGFLLSHVLCLGLPKSYEVILISFSAHPDDNRSVLDISNLGIKGRERAVNGTIVILEDLDDTYEVYAHTFSDPNGSGNFRQLPMVISRTPVCKGMKEYIKKYTYPTLIPGVNTDFPFDARECPIRKGTYYMKNVQVDPTPFPDFMPRGYTKGIFYFVKGEQKMGEAAFVIQIKDRML